MLNLKFKNKGEVDAIALNAENMNLIVDEINNNSKKVEHITSSETEIRIDKNLYVNDKMILDYEITEEWEENV